MTTPIKPPGTAGSPAISHLPTPKESAGANFRAELATTPEVPSARETTPLASPSGAAASAATTTNAIVEDLRAGRITSSEAVDAMVRGALESPMAKALGPQARERLEAAVRAQLANDPALAALVGDLDRGR